MIIDKVKKTIQKHNLLRDGEKVIIALSGGPDSVALLDIMFKISQQMNLCLIVAHFNHEMRGAESEEDEEYCRRVSEKYGLSFITGKMDETKKLKGESPENFYRRQRYVFLNEVAHDQQADKIALGHNLQDQAETVLLRLLRGTSLEGLKGILPIRGNKFIRPLIDISREQIIKYLKDNGIEYRKDSSNESRRFLRNKIRHDLVPWLKEEFNPNIEKNLAQTAQILRQEDDFIKEFVEKAMQSSFVSKTVNGFSLDVEYLFSLHPAVRQRLFKYLLENLTEENQPILFAHIDAVENIIYDNKTGKIIHLPGQVRAEREYNRLILERRKALQNKNRYEYPLVIDGSFYIKEKNVTICLQRTTRDYINYENEHNIYMDLDTLKPPLFLRSRRDGDWFEPIGMGGRKKVKDYFIDQKIPREKRDKVMLIADSVSVVWVEKMRLSERVKITDKTKNVLEIKITETLNDDV